MASIPKAELPGYVRRCYNAWKKANITTREAENDRLRCYAGGDLMWRDAEIQKRREQGRPWITINKVKPAVDQVEGDIRLNPPGPQSKPVGENADAADPDIIDGLIRECEYRSGAKVAYSTAGKYSAISGYGVLELATEYCNDRDDSQQLVILSVEDPSTVFFDPTARMANRQDARWAGKIKQYSKDEYIAVFGKNRKVLQPGGVQMASGWLQDAFGVGSEDTASLMEWTGTRDGGEGRWQGPFYVCEFYMIETEDRQSRLYSDKIWRIDGESVPDGVTPMKGDQYARTSPNRTVRKYLVDALEAQDDTEWLGTLIPLFPVLGPEIYIEGKLHRLSLISGAMDSNRALNYVATTATEIAGLTTKSPWIGPKGSFDDPRWESSNSEVWAYLEYTPVTITDETTGGQKALPAPQRNQWEAPIQWLLALGGFFSDAIKAATSIYDPSLGQNKNDQSGKALEQLRSESNVANFSYADNLHRAIEIMYQQMCVIFPKIYDGPRVLAIVRPDSQHEMIAINREFPDGIDPATGKKGKKNTIPLGQYSVRVVVGPNFETRQDEALTMLLDTIKVNPQILGNPTVTAKLIRMIGKGNPEMEGIADIISPPANGDVNPQQLQQQLQQSQQQIQQLTAGIQQMHQAIEAKLPQVEATKFKALLDNLTKIRVAEITASKDADSQAANLEAARLEHMMGMAHDAGIQAQEHEHAAGQAQFAVDNAPEPEPAGATK